MLCLICNPIQFALALDALNTNNQRESQVTQWTTSYQISELITIFVTQMLDLKSLNRPLVTTGISNSRRNQHGRQVSRYQISESIKILSVSKMDLNGLKVNLVTNGNQLKTPTDTGTSQRLPVTLHTHTMETVDSLIILLLEEASELDCTHKYSIFKNFSITNLLYY
jgi:hypothetical protein